MDDLVAKFGGDFPLELFDLL